MGDLWDLNVRRGAKSNRWHCTEMVTDSSSPRTNSCIVEEYLFHNLTLCYNEMGKTECGLGRQKLVNSKTN